MSVVKYNKLVRDKIIEIIEADGKKAEFQLVKGKELYNYLIQKLQEEVDEFKEDGTAEELTDILELIEAFIGILGLDWEKIFEIKEEKAIKRGKFNKGIILKNVIF
jgi:predicted house-cleaning noncanonical NTP pyrophosphatase (MazG superfamily)